MTRSMIAALALIAALLGTAGARADGMKTPHNDLLNATLWTQTSVEFKATAQAAYSLATLMLDRALADTSWTAALEQTGDFAAKPPAVILDVDETVLDNSAYEAWVIKENTHFSSKTWTPFVDAAISKPIPGSLAFTKYAAAKGVAVFYVTNRKAHEEDGTRRNLKAFGYPVDEKMDTVLVREENDWGRTKSERRAHVAKDYRVLLLIGDNLGDFTDEDGSPAERQAIYEKHMDRWSTSWIMIANPMYGSWESAAFGGNWKLDSDTRRQMKLQAMEYWEGPK